MGRKRKSLFRLATGVRVGSDAEIRYDPHDPGTPGNRSVRSTIITIVILALMTGSLALRWNAKGRAPYIEAVGNIARRRRKPKP